MSNEFTAADLRRMAKNFRTKPKDIPKEAAYWCPSCDFLITAAPPLYYKHKPGCPIAEDLLNG